LTIQIDDAGWGSPIGGVLIAGYRPETGEFAVAEIAVAHFQPPRFQRRTYLDGAVDATRQVLDMLASPADERVETLALAGTQVPGFAAGSFMARRTPGLRRAGVPGKSSRSRDRFSS
jgi:hypothetical protein